MINEKSIKINNWAAAIGLQAVDGLRTSQLLNQLSEENISGTKSFQDIKEIIRQTYGDNKNRLYEADMVACNIAETLEMPEFIMSADFLASTHRQLFEDVLEINGNFRDYNIMKREMILLGDSVHYADHLTIKARLNKIMDDEKSYKYSAKLTDSDIDHLSSFTSKLWQTHPFGEGNTRTTAVFIELYIKTLGYDVNNEPFKNNSTYYRNALVRSCYESTTYNSVPTNKFLNRFYMNLLNDSKNVLDSFDLFISNNDD